MYKIIADEIVEKSLAKIHPNITAQIEDKIENYLTKSPRELGKLLTPWRNGIYSHRHGDYRILYRILESEKTIVISKIGHRKEVYD